MRNRSDIRIIIISSFMIMLLGCNPLMVPLKGKYNEKATEIITSQSVDSTWSKVLQIFTTNGLQIKNMDKTNGTVRTVEAPINSIYTFEDNGGQLEKPQAWVVISRTFNKKKEWKPKDIYGQWNIQITKAEVGVTILKVDPIIICTYFSNTFIVMEARGQSTGKLEELLERSLNSN